MMTHMATRSRNGNAIVTLAPPSPVGDRGRLAPARSTRARSLRNFRTAAWIFGALLLNPIPLSAAVVIDANVAGVFTDLSFTTPTSAVLYDGDGVLIHVDVSNPDAHDVQALFVTLTIDTDRLSFIGGSLEPRILVDPGPFGTTFLTALHTTAVGKVDDSTGSTLTG
jgi:hypothetical protein